VGQIQLVTHAIKYINPNARGSNFYFRAEDAVAPEAYVCTDCLKDFEGDVVGNAAALDVYKFLKQEHLGRSILNYILDHDPTVIKALSDDQEQAESWARTFAGITGSGRDRASHKLAKQVYFPLEDGGYHLLAPLFPSSLVQVVYIRMREDRFSEKSKEARKARRENQACEHGYADYPDMSVQAFGGTKPQNISQLNSERHGESWLLSSKPPIWKSLQIKAPLGVSTIFGRWFSGRASVRSLNKSLSDYLRSTDYNNVHIRQGRARLVDLIVDEVLQFAAEMEQLEPGWSADPACKLDQVEKLWLDPGRAELDQEFKGQRNLGKWQKEIADRFGNWLNKQLNFSKKKRLTLGQDEHEQWTRLMEKALQGFKKELSHD
jgi:CRISPR-associated protein Csy1